MSLGIVQQLITNPMASALDEVLGWNGPETLEGWIRTNTAMIEEIPAGGLEDGVRSHPMLRRVAGPAIRQALAGWDPDWAATTLTVMYGVAPAVAQKKWPQVHEQVTEAIRQMCQRLGQPDAFPWFCDQCAAVAERIRTILSDNPPPAA